MKAELIKPPETITDESIKQYLADCSSVVRDKQPKNNDALFKRLTKESYGNMPSRVFEFVPCKLTRQDIMSQKPVPNQMFGFWTGLEDRSVEPIYWTTARELINWGYNWEDILKKIDFTYYETVKIECPYFIYGQVSTHNQITTVSHSNRYTEAQHGFWYPDEFEKWFDPKSIPDTSIQDTWNFIVQNTPPVSLKNFMSKELGIKRREVWSRGYDMLQNRTATLGGFTNNPHGWEHFINQRKKDLHTQLETRELTGLISNIVN